MKKSFFSALLVTLTITLSIQSAHAESYPKGPEDSMTPGELCGNGAVRRYPEQINYCERDVDPELKRQIIKEYDEQFGYSIRRMDRRNFKIDHLIPLCAGGANSIHNLWPQHMSVYEITDPLESIGCEKLSEGLIKQKELINLILTGKHDLKKVPIILRELESL